MPPKKGKILKVDSPKHADSSPQANICLPKQDEYAIDYANAVITNMKKNIPVLEGKGNIKYEDLKKHFENNGCICSQY